MGSIIIDSTKLDTIFWKHLDTTYECDSFFGEKISERIKSVQERPILLLLSGGSSFAVLDFIHTDNWKNITITMIDERFEKENTHNNFSQLERTDWYTHTKKNGATFLSTKIQPADTQEIMAHRWENSIKSWQKENLNGTLIALFGIGADGHTAGIFSYPQDQKLFENLFLGNRLIVSYDASGKNEFPSRVTTTHTFHRLISYAYISLKGEEKQQMLQRLIQHKALLHELPAEIFSSLPNVTIGTTLNL